MDSLFLLIFIFWQIIDIMFFLCYFILTLEYYIWGEKMKKQLLLLLALGAISQGAFGKEFIGKGNGYGGL